MFKFKESYTDKCIYRGIVNDEVVYLVLFVDDGLIVNKSKVAIQVVINKLKGSFEITVTEINSFIGMQIERDRANKRMFVHQSAYTRNLLRKFNFDNAKGVCIPADPHTILTNVDSNDSELVNVPFREAVGSLMFLSLVTRPDIAYSINVVSRYLEKHT